LVIDFLALKEAAIVIANVILLMYFL